jgi:hypothetical protein
MPLPRNLAVVLLVVVLVPLPSRADGLIFPYLGANYGGDSRTEPYGLGHQLLVHERRRDRR